MTRTFWLAACAAALLSGGRAARAQEASVPSGGPKTWIVPLTTEAPRAPYYYELPQLLFPAQSPPVSQCSSPVVWERVFDAVARTHCQTNTGGARDQARRESRDRRMAFELLKLYRLFYREGHYKAAEIVADRAVQIDPTNPAAEHALAMARLATAAIDSACDDGAAEDCENANVPAPRCGMCPSACGTSQRHCQGSATKPSCACDAKCCCDTDKSSCKCGDSCACAKAKTCACGAKCCCDTDKSSCKCGDSCACGKSGRRDARIRHRRRLMMVPPCMPMPGAAMMPYTPMPFAPVFQGPASMLPGANVMMPLGLPMPPGMMPPPPFNVMSPICPGHWAGGRPPMAAQAERLPMPQLIAPQSAPQANVLVNAIVCRTPAQVQIRVCDKQVQITCPCLEACCDTVSSLADGRVLLEGDVVVTFHVVDRPAKIVARRMIVDLHDGSYEVNPRNVQPQTLKSVSFEENARPMKKKPGCCESKKPAKPGCKREICPNVIPTGKFLFGYAGTVTPELEPLP